MDKKSLMTNFRVMFVMYLLMILFIILFLFSFSLEVNALEDDSLEVTQWGNSTGSYIDTVDSYPFYTYSDYNPESIMNFIYEKSNERFFDNTYTIEEFYSHFTYIVQAYNSTTIRVLVQNYDRITFFQGFSPIEGQPIKFYFANMTTNKLNGTYWNYYGGISALYSYYIDIDYNSMSYTFSNNNPLLDINFYSLSRSYKYVSISNPTTDYSNMTLYLNCLDSYNNNFAWIEFWNKNFNNSSLWSEVAGNTGQSYFNYPTLEIPDLLYTSPGVDLPTPDEPEEPGSDNSEVVDKIEESNTILGAILDKVNDLIDTITDTVDDFTDTIGDFFNDFTEIDPNGISGIVSLPLRLIRGIINNDSCQPLILPIFGTQVAVPSGCMLWSLASSEITTLWQTIICGLGSYFILVDAFKLKDRLLDPKSKEVDTLQL